MAWIFTENAADFLAAAGEFLLSRPVEHTIELGVAETVRRRGRVAFGPSVPLFGWWRTESGLVECTFLHTPPFPCLLAGPAMPSVRDRRPVGEGHPGGDRQATGEPAGQYIGELAGQLASFGRWLPGVNSAEGVAMAFAAAWQQRTGAEAKAGLRSRLYRLGELRPPSPWPPGAARVAGAADAELLEDWFARFSRELGDSAPAIPGAVADRISQGGLTLWETDGMAVSMAGVNRPMGGTVRVGPVYTPGPHRQHGYGAAVTAAVSSAALDAGARAVVLFTDIANPTSNSLYQRLGYRPVEDRVVLRFVRALSASAGAFRQDG
jgi:RimJ/RimL family protein N-acetyltransferase